MNHNNTAIIITLFCLLKSIDSFSQEEETVKFKQPVQEVFQTELVYPQEKNEFQITLPFTYQKSKEDKHLIIPVNLEYGISDAWQLEIGWNSYQYLYMNSDIAVQGIGDIEIGTKYSFMNINDSNFHAAIGFEIGLPLGDEDKELSEGMVEYEPYVILALDFPEFGNAQVFTQAGVSFLQQEEQEEGEEPETHEISVNGGFFIPFRQLIFTSELNWNASYTKDSSENQFYYTPGMVWNLPSSWEIGIGMPIGLNQESDAYRCIAMIIYEFDIGGDTD